MAGKTLVNSPEAGEFTDTMTLNAGRNSRLADPKHFADVPNASVAIEAAHAEFRYVLPKIAALPDDPTRTLPELHDVGRQFAERTVEVLTNTHNTLTKEATKARSDAYAIINDSFAADPSREGIQSEIRSWIRENARTEGGLAKVREAVETNPEVASVLYHSPDFLLGLADVTRKSMMMDGVIAHLPTAAALMERSSALDKAASGYPQVIKSVHASFYVAGLAAQMARRVEA